MWGVYWLGFFALLAAGILREPYFLLFAVVYLVVGFFVVDAIEGKIGEMRRQRYRQEYRRKFMEQYGQDPDDIADGPWEGGEVGE